MMAARGLLCAFFVVVFAGSFSRGDGEVNTAKKPFDILDCWPHDYIYPDPQPECDVNCQCTFRAPSGRIYTPFHSEPDPTSKAKFQNIDLSGFDAAAFRFHGDNFTLGSNVDSENYVQIGQGMIQIIDEATPDRILATLTSSKLISDDGRGFVSFLPGNQFFVAFYTKDDIGKKASFFQYEGIHRQFAAEVFKNEDPTIVEPPLNDDGDDYLVETTKTWKLEAQPGKTWKIKVLTFDVSPNDELLLGSGEPSDASPDVVTIIDSTSIGESFEIPTTSGFIKFTSTVHNKPSTGFSLEVKQVPVSDEEQQPTQLVTGSSCDANGCNYTALSGVIDLSNPILGSENLTFRISGPQDSKVIIRFNRIGEGSNTDAILEPGNKVSIGYGGPESQTPSKESLLAWFRSNAHLVHMEPNLVQIPIPYDNAWILIDEKGENPEYTIEYQIIPPTIAEEIIDEAGPVVLLPPFDFLNMHQEDDYASNARWVWRLVTPENETQSGVRWIIKVKNFHLDEDSKDFLEFGLGERPDGVNEHVVLRAYGKMGNREVVIDSPEGYIYMESNLHVKPMPGFDLSVRRVYTTESNDIRDHEEPAKVETGLPNAEQKATECWPADNPPDPPLPDCDAKCQCLYSATESTVYTPLFSETTVAMMRKFQNFQVPGADYLMFFMSNQTFWVDNDKQGQPNQRSRNTVAFGQGNLDAFYDVFPAGAKIPPGTVQQFFPIMDYGPYGEVRVPIFNNSAFGNYAYGTDGGYPDNTKANFRYKAYSMNSTVQNVMESGPMKIESLMDDVEEDYAFAQNVTWRLMGGDGNTWNITIMYIDIDWNNDALAIGPGSMPPQEGNNEWPTYLLLNMNTKQPKTFIIDSPTAFISFRSTLHATPRRGFSFEVTRLGDSATESPNITSTTEEPLPLTPEPGVEIERTFLMLDLDFSLDQISGSNDTAGDVFLANLVDAVVATCNEFDKRENLSLAEPVAARHVDAVVRACGSCFDKKTCAKTTLRVTVSNLDGYYAFTSETIARMLSEKHYKDFFSSRSGGNIQLGLHCDFTWWYWALAGVTFFAAVVSTIAWRMNQKGKSVKKNQIMASSDSAFFSQESEPTKLNGGFNEVGFGHEAHYNSAFHMEDDEESDDDTLYDREEIRPRLVPGSGFNGDDRLVEPT